MSQMQIWRLSSGKVVVSKGGSVEILTPPVGVSYDIHGRRWQAWVLNDKREWVKEYFNISTNGGPTAALENACMARDKSLTYLLTVRLLPRIRKGYDPISVGNLFAVWNPLGKKRHFFESKAAALAYNEQAVREWVQEYLYDPANMVEIRNLMSMSWTGEGEPCL